MRKSLKTTTALVAGLHLAFPQTGFAQNQISIEELLEVCADFDAATCATATGVPEDQVAEAMRMAQEAAAGAEAEAAETAEEAGTDAIENAEEAAELPEAEPAAEAEALSAESEQPEAAPVEGEGVEAAQDAAEQPAEPSESAEAVESAPAEGEGMVDATADEQMVDEEPALVDTSDTPEMIDTDDTPLLTEQGDATAETAPAPEADATESAAAPEADAAATDSAAAPAADAAATEEAAAPEAEAAATDSADAPEADAAATDTAATPESEASEAPADTATAESADALPEEGIAPETQTTDAERQALEGSNAAPVAAAALDAAPAEEVATETVTEETARSSDEDFDSEIARETGDAPAAAASADAQAASDDDDDDGLSTLQKALIAGAGVLAVGTLLNNNRQVVASSQDRVVVSGRDGGYELIKDDTALLRRPGTEVSTERFDDGSTRTTVLREDGSQIVTIRDSNLRVLQRVRVTPEGERIVLIDDTIETQAVDVTTLRPAARTQVDTGMDQDALRQALAAEGAFDRSFSLAQVRNISQVREQVPAIDLENITFATASAAIAPEQADELTDLGSFIRARVAENPREIFLVEGHTDAVGNAAYNLALSDRRAESVALALTEYFDVPPENLVVQGYGERFLKVPTLESERQNRRATVRRITPLLQTAAAQ